LGIERNYTESIKWYTKFLNNDINILLNNYHEAYSLATYNLGYIYNELGGEINYQKAMELYKKSAKEKYSMACNNIGAYYMNGQGVERDYIEACNWLEKALKYDPLNQLAKYNLSRAKTLKATSCFIATAVYNSPTAPKVMILREFRDQKLLTHKYGEAFVQFYYRYSPPIADYIAKRKVLSEVVRVAFIEPLVWIVQCFTNRKFI